ncbi:TetR/AcrR family transcriptional regulator [Spirochaeta africana]|uniref:Transcriptional regulator n=1 Tax=Spirochaeta africana (strain ATCC 700263 / DSM 8902 / Z-7692) TaxID=889378 RepID=H9UMX0_SPIAZ|nr:TetR/AcrR family transcriptional regulator [Spirochaeta africana]AFG38863.1 transcriptional regulator [Spirochaeta africana DSM 8902]
MEQQFTTKQLKRREQIVAAGLVTWQHTDFSVLTMDAVAAELGVSKPALYRYFSSKDELIRAIDDSAAHSILTHGSSWLSATGSADLLTMSMLLVQHAAALFTENPYALQCVTARRYFLEPASRTALLALGKQMEDRLADRADRDTADYLLFSAAVWNIYRHFCGSAPAEHQQLLNHAAVTDGWILERCLNGIAGPQAKSASIDYVGVEQAFTPNRSETRREPHRIFTAIEQVVSEVGVAEATVQRIAERIGISTSSLYFHFSDRSDMITQTIEQERQHFIELLHRCRADFTGSPLEQLYGLMLLLDTYYRINPEILTVGNWIRSQTVRIAEPPSPPNLDQDFPFLTEGITSGWYTDQITSFSILAYLQMFVIHHRFFDAGRKESPCSIACMRRRFRLAFYGIETQGNTR